MDNTILSYNGIEIYQNDIDILCDEYINNLPMPDLIYTKSNVFLGLLDYIYKHSIKPIVKLENGYNNDYKALDLIFNNLYIPLCYRFNKTPTVISFASFTHIDYETLTDIKNGIYRNPVGKVNINHCQIVKKWFKSCESSLVNKTVDENGIGSMFLLKSVYGYTEQQNITVISQIESNQDPKAIAEKYKSVSLPDKLEI